MFSAALGFQPSFDDLVPFADKNLEALRVLVEAPLADAMMVKLTGSDRNEIAQGLLRYLEVHTESAIHIRSLAVLRELFA